LLKWGTPTLENPGNCWKNPDFGVFPENSHPWTVYIVCPQENLAKFDKLVSSCSQNG
jgi:hypothetical protein